MAVKKFSSTSRSTNLEERVKSLEEKVNLQSTDSNIVDRIASLETKLETLIYELKACRLPINV